jgi:hypothetical protein
VITPAVVFNPTPSAPGGESGRSIDAIDEPLVCRDVRDPTEPTFSRSPPRYLPPSSLTFLLSLSFLLLLEKKDFPPDDCLDLLSADMVRDCVIKRSLCTLSWTPRCFFLGCAGPRTDCSGLLCSSMSQTQVFGIMARRNRARVVEPRDLMFGVSRAALH